MASGLLSQGVNSIKKLSLGMQFTNTQNKRRFIHFCYLKEMANNFQINGYRAGNYIFKVNNRNTRAWCEIWSKLTIR